MTIKIAALAAIACTIAACDSIEGRAQSPAPGGSKDRGAPRAVRMQPLDPVIIQGVKPLAEPRDRYSAAICDRDDKRCNLTVRVSRDCHVTLDPEWIAIGRRHDRVTLVFTLVDSPGFSLQKSAVHPKSKDGENVLRNERVDGNVVEVDVENHFKMVKHYAIDVHKGREVCATLDPPIIPDL